MEFDVDSLEVLQAAIAEVVDDRDLDVRILLIDEPCEIRADETGSTGDQYLHVRPSSVVTSPWVIQLATGFLDGPR